MNLLFFRGTGFFPDNLIICIVLTIAGAIMVYRMSKLMSRELKLMQHFIRSSGEVIEIHYDENGLGFPLIEYETSRFGVLQNLSKKVATHLHHPDPDTDMEIGKRVVVHYNENDPADFYIGETRGKPAKILVLIIGAFFLVAGLGGLLSKI
jgi:Protein of unknown function (DUF3592)